MKLTDEFEKLKAFNAIRRELSRAEAIHPNFPKDMFKQLAIMQEEAGEVAKAVLQYHDEDGNYTDIKEELIQTASSCIRMLINLNPKNQ